MNAWVPISLGGLAIAGASGIVRMRREVHRRKRAEELVELRTEALKAFGYTVSHDLKAPLRGIAGYAQELDRQHRSGLGERAQFCIDQILTATRNLDRLIDDLLLYSRVDSEARKVTDVNVPRLIQGILEERGLTIAERGVQVTTAIPFTTIRTWERGLTQVLANVVDNALKYSRGAHPPLITIAGETLANAFRVSIADNGIGFDMKYHDRIFGLFNRLVRAEEFEGTGAGLAITKKLVDKLGGKIWAEARPQAGATFFIELPRQPHSATAI